MSQQILVVDDEEAIADLVEVYLTNEGFTVRKFGAAAPALAHVEKDPPDLAILDVMLLNTDGRMCMDQLCVDVTDIPCVRPGDTTTLIEIGTEILSFGQRSCPGGAAPSLTD